ncbi:RNA binding protein [Zostera marina]|uniref:RNA binding protein n=1 Tax=Zostera marina TaxID=29655 RepID=A0A0K9PEV2_ZOSMR|nr:RNA binding protein [Zostera marina]
MASLAAVAMVSFSSSSTFLIKTVPIAIYKPTLPHFYHSSIRFLPLHAPSSLLSVSHSDRQWLIPRVSAVQTADPQQEHDLGEDKIASSEHSSLGNVVKGDGKVSEAVKSKIKPGRLYVCNLPDSFDISDLLNLFKPFGTVLSLEFPRNAETGTSRGCGYAMLSSLAEAKVAIVSLDGSDIGGREIRVKLCSNNFKSKKSFTTSLSPSSPFRKDLIFESPHKAYIGNLDWSITVESLKEHFTKFGSVVSARLLRDKKFKKKRVYGFVSFASADQLKAAAASSGTDFNGRPVLIREVVKEPSDLIIRSPLHHVQRGSGISGHRT